MERQELADEMFARKQREAEDRARAEEARREREEKRERYKSASRKEYAKQKDEQPVLKKERVKSMARNAQ